MKVSDAKWGLGIAGVGAVLALGGCTTQQIGTWFPDEAAQIELREAKAQPASAALVATLEPTTRPTDPPPHVVDIGFPASGMRPVGWIDQTGGYGPGGYGPVYGPAYGPGGYGDGGDYDR